jgi:hypothetical protein
MEKLGQENLGKDWAEGRTRKLEDLERLERLDRLENTGELWTKKGRSASPNATGIRVTLNQFNKILPHATLRMRGPRLVRNSTHTGYITIDYLYYNNLVLVDSSTTVLVLQYYYSIH